MKQKRFSHPLIFDEFCTLHLPLWRRVVFVDWHGVLCRDVFWQSILGNPKHPYHKELSRATSALFRDRGDTVRLWMRGELDAQQVINSLNVSLDRRCRPDFLTRRLAADLKRMRVFDELLHAIPGYCFLVLATDNMASFLEQLRAFKSVASSVNSVLCSAVLGVLKSENPERFFGPWLGAHGLAFSDALLIDDSRKNCELFSAAGGASICHHDLCSTVQAVRCWWQGTQPRTTTAGSSLSSELSQ
jgi:FMN phosphatase YigB (HAD superfamily)